MKKGYDLQSYLIPFWDTDRIENETFMFLGEEDSAPFLYAPEKIGYVRNFSLNTLFEEGKDYVIENGRIRRLKGSRIPFYAPEEYYVKEPGAYGIGVNKAKIPYDLDGDRYLVYGEEDTFTKNQIAVSYTTTQRWTGFIPQGKSQRFSEALRKLKSAETLKITFYGDSITTGCNSSGTPMGGNVPPYMDSFPDMICDYLREKYGARIEMTNVAVGGWSTKNGLDAFDERVLPSVPDLLILGFGMNDSWTDMNEYRKMIEEMILRLRKVNPKAEILLIATMLPHVESTWFGNQQYNRVELSKLEQENDFVAVADVTSMHESLLATGKRYRDMTGNNINHPNDFFVRVYAQVILKTLLGDEYCKA